MKNQHDCDCEEHEDDDRLCGTCNGSGEGMVDGSSCSSCHGSGNASEARRRQEREEARGDYLYDLWKDER